MLTRTDWFQDTDSVLDVLRGDRHERRSLPNIPGYEQVEEIGRGGQAVVYSALQRSTQQRVAIKVLLDGAYATSSSLRRFEREIELVAALRHPNIVRVYDSGVSTDGRPFCVMEFIAGVPLDHYLKSHAIDQREILNLFLGICDAVQHAHQHGVMHRDLKPSNIRVDAEGQPHVLDFGLAKAADDGAARQYSFATVTHSGHFFGSLPWTSPEQVRGDSAQIDLRADVYALGVLLYQALTGRFPYDVSGPMHEVSQRILNVEPTRLTRVGRSIHDDLSTIVLKCLTKEPARRYQSAGDVAADIRRYLNGDPIQARADSTWYVFHKTLRRHRVFVGSITALIILLTGFGVTMSVMYRQTRVARDRAQAEADKAAAVNDFLNQMLLSVMPNRNGYRVTVAEVLEQATHDVPNKFAAQPEIEAALESTMGEAFINLGHYAEGERHARRAYDIRRHLLGEDHLDTLASLEICLQNPDSKSNKAEQITLLRHIFEVRRRVLGADDPRTILAEAALHSWLVMLDPVAEDLELKNMVEHARRVLGDKHTITLGIRIQRIRVLNILHRPVEAEALARRVLAVAATFPDPEHEYKLAAMMSLGDSLVMQKRYEEALPQYRFPYDVKIRVLGPRHPATLTSAQQLVLTYKALNQPAQVQAIVDASGVESLATDRLSFVPTP